MYKDLFVSKCRLADARVSSDIFRLLKVKINALTKRATTTKERLWAALVSLQSGCEFHDSHFDMLVF